MNPAEWAAHDPDRVTRAQVQRWLEADDPRLRERFAGPLTFGTAGLRGPIGAGETAMNVATVTRATAGLAAWLGAGKRVVLGCDARHGSAAFRDATAEVLSAAGIEVLALPPQLPTPLTAFAVRHFAADAGVMITASHNPATDNGYKVYDASGSQIIPPSDSEIALLIDAAGWADEIPRSRSLIREVDVREEYLARAVSLIDAPASQPVIVTTAMHGVGGAVLAEALRRAGFENVHPVVKQAHPDPDFPTVAFPNPEEDGALDLAFALAEQIGADLILALDPDADRCAVAMPGRQFTGDEIGAILGWDAASRASGGTLACSNVSSRLLGKIAAHHGLVFEETPTGFKWIARVPNLIFGYEEALGYCVDPQWVADKDGITACLKVAEVASRSSLETLLEELGERFGYHLTKQVAVRVAEPAGEMRVRENGPDRVIVRPSGTEPKIKYYYETIQPTRAQALDRLDQLLREA
ncbi:MAG: phospho-sugar mutase [Corynebacterium sp.]|uniref:phospho-sugar mutase n=1 Tax=Corynebacterium sp. TaxID=1720 RepID=UPI0026E05AEC|nr:phospho-sugar mutase [Corynebacterium sp.]MDO5671087.1 phospho-sugar mutase [Corynebacterium sp.]